MPSPIFAVLLAVSLLSLPALAGKPVAIRAGRLVDPEAGTAVRDQIILVEDKTIKAVWKGLSKRVSRPFATWATPETTRTAIWRRPSASGSSPGPTQPAKKLHAEYVERLRRAYKAGVMLVYGTDLSVDLPGESRGALASGYVDSYTEAGVPAKVILQAMTANAARLLQVAKQRGAIRPASPPTSWPPRRTL